ncbi:helix-turn-helix domain-containing protein [Glycomyces tarimensis]
MNASELASSTRTRASRAAHDGDRPGGATPPPKPRPNPRPPNQSGSAKPLLTAAEFEAEYGIPRKTLANWRSLGTGPQYTKSTPGRGGRIRYRRIDIEAWLDEITVAPASVT